MLSDFLTAVSRLICKAESDRGDKRTHRIITHTCANTRGQISFVASRLSAAGGNRPFISTNPPLSQAGPARTTREAEQRERSGGRRQISPRFGAHGGDSSSLLPDDTLEGEITMKMCRD